MALIIPTNVLGSLQVGSTQVGHPNLSWSHHECTLWGSRQLGITQIGITPSRSKVGQPMLFISNQWDKPHPRSSKNEVVHHTTIISRAKMSKSSLVMTIKCHVEHTEMERVLGLVHPCLSPRCLRQGTSWRQEITKVCPNFDHPKLNKTGITSS